MSTLTLTIDRTSLALSDLVITQDFTASMFFAKDGQVRPDMDYRRGYAPDSAYVPGKTILTAVLEASTLPLTVYFQASSAAALRTAENVLVTALAQWAYDVTLDIDGEAETWTGEPTRPAFGDIDSSMVAAFMSRAVLTIPINPQ